MSDYESPTGGENVDPLALARQVDGLYDRFSYSEKRRRSLGIATVAWIAVIVLVSAVFTVAVFRFEATREKIEVLERETQDKIAELERSQETFVSRSNAAEAALGTIEDLQQDLMSRLEATDQSLEENNRALERTAAQAHQAEKYADEMRNRVITLRNFQEEVTQIVESSQVQLGALDATVEDLTVLRDQMNVDVPRALEGARAAKCQNVMTPSVFFIEESNDCKDRFEELVFCVGGISDPTGRIRKGAKFEMRYSGESFLPDIEVPGDSADLELADRDRRRLTYLGFVKKYMLMRIERLVWEDCE